MMEDRRTITKFPAGVVTLPASKSYAHRAVICGALAAREGGSGSVISNLILSQDIEATLESIQGLGYGWTMGDRSVRMEGGGTPTDGVIGCRESGSTLRFLIPLAALEDREITFTGSPRLLERPQSVYEAVFRQSGVSFHHGSDAIKVHGKLRPGRYEMRGDVSSQFVTGLLLVLPLLEGDSEIVLTSPLESRAYVDMTLEIMARYGVKVTESENSYRVPGGQRYAPADYTVEADFSQSAYFLGAAALGCPVRCAGLNTSSLQGDRAILEVLRDMGADITEQDGVLSVRAGRLKAVTVDARQCPDLVPPIAVLCSLAEGTSRIINAGRLRIKESDRLTAMATELNKLGADVEEGPDSLTIHGKPFLAGGEVDAHNDHRIAMSMALAAIRCQGPVTLTGASSVGKSYPRFWQDFEREEGPAWQTPGDIG